MRGKTYFYYLALGIAPRVCLSFGYISFPGALTKNNARLCGVCVRNVSDRQQLISNYLSKITHDVHTYLILG